MRLTLNNWHSSCLEFQDRQAGGSLVYCPVQERFVYNAYCIEKKLLKELFTVEFEYIDDAIRCVNEEFSTWEWVKFEEKKSGCGTCVAK